MPECANHPQGTEFKTVELKANVGHMGCFFGSDELSDCMVVTTDGTRTPCHKVALASSSPVFRAMFTTSRGMAEGSGTVHVQAAEPAIVQLLLRHMYGINVKVPLQDLIDFFKLADQYQVRSAIDSLQALVKSYPLTAQEIQHLMPAAAQLGKATAVVRSYLAVKAAGFVDALLTSPDGTCKWEFTDLIALLKQPRLTAHQRFQLATTWICSDKQRLQHWPTLQRHINLQLIQYADLKALQDRPELAEIPALAHALFVECLRRMDHAKALVNTNMHHVTDVLSRRHISSMFE